MKLRSSQPVEETHVHHAAIEHARVAAIGIGQDRFRSKLGADLLQSRDNLVECLVPGDSLKCVVAARSLGRNSAAWDKERDPANKRDQDTSQLCRTGIRGVTG